MCQQSGKCIAKQIYHKTQTLWQIVSSFNTTLTHYHQPQDCLLKRLFGRTSKKTSKLRVTGLCEGNSPMTGELLAQRASNAENVSIWWHHHRLGYIPIIVHTLCLLLCFVMLVFSHMHWLPHWHWSKYAIALGPQWGNTGGNRLYRSVPNTVYKHVCACLYVCDMCVWVCDIVKSCS